MTERYAYQLSSFNLFVTLNKGQCYFVFNTLKDSALLLPPAVYERLQRGAPLEPPDLHRLLDSGIIVDSQTNQLHMLKGQMILERNPPYGTLSLTICPTLDCNLNCPYCYQGGWRQQNRRRFRMGAKVKNSLVQWVKSNLPDHRGLQVAWYGGEPLLEYPTICELSAAFIGLCEEAGKDYSSQLITNGLNLTPKVCQQLKEKARVNSVQLTLEMPPERHATRRVTLLGKNILPTLLRHIRTALRYFKVNLRLNIEPGDTAPEILNRCADFLKEENLLGHPNLIISPAFIDYAYRELPSAEIGDSNECLPCPEKERNVESFFSFADRLMAILNPSSAVGLSSENRSRMIYETLRKFRIRRTCCALQRDSFVVLPDGAIHKCWETMLVPDLTIGSVTSGVHLFNQAFAFWTTVFPTDDPICKKCVLLPICCGGCTFLRTRGMPRRIYCCTRGYIELVAQLAGEIACERLGLDPVEAEWLASPSDSLPDYLRGVGKAVRISSIHHCRKLSSSKGDDGFPPPSKGDGYDAP